MDRFLEFESGHRARAIKNVSLAEEHLHDHFPGFPVMPGSLIIEGLAQAGGVLIGEANGFSQRVILGKIPNAEFFDVACAGDQLTYDVELADLRPEGARIMGQAHVGDRLIAEVELFFVHLDRSHTEHLGLGDDFVFTDDLLSMLRLAKAGGRSAEPAPGDPVNTETAV